MVNKVDINGAVLEIFVGEFLNTNYDAMVLPTNSRLLPSGTLRVSCLKAAGAKVQVECNRIINKISTLAIGAAVMTSGGDLNSKYLIHTVPPKLGVGHEGKKLMLCTWNSLKLADEASLKTILFPPMAKDMLGFTAKICADVMLPTIKKYLKEAKKNLTNVSVCVDTLPDYKVFETVLDSFGN